MRVLLLGGTTEAGLMARALAAAGIDTVYSYAGRTAALAPQPVPVRVGGFGGVEGLADCLRDGGFTHMVDATHAFAAGISANAIAAAGRAGVRLVALERPAWQAGPGDRWTVVPDIAGAVAALPGAPSRVFLSIGRQSLAPFAARAQHHYVLRLVDAPEGPLPLPDAVAVIARGPFTLEGDLALLRGHGVQVIVAKNAGGGAARSKLDAARQLDLPVIMVDRPAIPARQVVTDVDGVIDWLHGTSPAGAVRGV